MNMPSTNKISIDTLPTGKISKCKASTHEIPVEKRTRWGEKPYYSLDYYLRQAFGEKVYKLALDLNMTCPNRDGTLGTRGCIFCSQGGSGEFAAKGSSITGQIDSSIQFIHSHMKYTGDKYIAYLQSFSNTYAPVESLRKIYLEALSHPQVVGLSIATRPDCFSPDIYKLLEECRQIKPVWIELGLQTIHERTARQIRRGYPLSCFENTVAKLRQIEIPVITHVILGLPGESREDMLKTIFYLNEQHIQGIKLQLLHVLSGTDLAKELPHLTLLTRQEYVQLIISCIAHLSPETVIHRLTGDGAGKLLLAPKWSLDKRGVLNDIAHGLKAQQVYQGKFYSGGSYDY